MNQCCWNAELHQRCISRLCRPRRTWIVGAEGRNLTTFPLFSLKTSESVIACKNRLIQFRLSLSWRHRLPSFPRLHQVASVATITKRGRRWFAQVRRAGVSKSKSFSRRLEAEAWAADLERRIENGSSITTTGRETLAAVMARYAAEVSPTKRGSRWEIIRMEHISRDPISEIQINRLTPEDIGQWRDRRLREVKPGTVLRDITLLTAVLEHARREWRMIETNPIRDVRKPPAPKARTRLPTDDEIERICIALGYDSERPVETRSQQIAVAFLLAIETAMRAGELLSLTWDQVDLPRRVARLDKTKNGDRRDVPLSTRAVELFEKLRELDSIRCFTVSAAVRDALFRRARNDAKVGGLTFHDSRALALTRLSKVFDLLELARVAGHRDPKSLMAYYRESAEELAKKLT